jgi:4,5-dihydroxyphthalate decarboxylase
MSNDSSVLTLRTLLGDYPNTMALKKGEVRAPDLVFDFADVKVPNTAFKDVVRHLKYDVAELAIVTYLQAKAHGKPLALLPAWWWALCRTGFLPTMPSAAGSRRPISRAAASASALIP